MISIKSYFKIAITCLLIAGVTSCSDPWEERTETTDANLKVNLSEALINLPQTSEFGKLLTETGFDQVLSSSKTYTVWAPTNEALAQVEATALSSIEAKRLFVQNHIALTAFSSVTEQDTVVVQMLSDKFLEFRNGNIIADAPLVTADQYTSNGLYHIISKALTPKANIWEYLRQQIPNNNMSSFLYSLDELNIYNSDSIAKANNVPGTFADSLTNTFLKNVYNLNNEKNKYTFFLLQDDAYMDEVDKLKPYLMQRTEDSTTTYASYFAVRDLAFNKAIARENLPDTLVSRFGIKVPLSDATIAEEIQLSNGVVYVLSALNIPLETRLVTTRIEGEEPAGFSQGDKRGNTFYREKEDPSGEVFYDIMVQNHRVPRFTIYYNVPNLYTTTYQVYWRAINDIQQNTFQQQLSFGGTISTVDGTLVSPFATLPYKNVEPNVYDEIYLGEFNITTRGTNPLLISLIAANSAADGTNTLTLDYLKLVPVIK